MHICADDIIKACTDIYIYTDVCNTHTYIYIYAFVLIYIYMHVCMNGMEWNGTEWNVCVCKRIYAFNVHVFMGTGTSLPVINQPAARR